VGANAACRMPVLIVVKLESTSIIEFANGGFARFARTG
jgi:hypothetical protein